MSPSQPSSKLTVRGIELSWDTENWQTENWQTENWQTESQIARATVVWCHGLTQSRELEQQRSLIDWSQVDAPVLRYDARGHGESTATDDPELSSWESMARDQLELASGVGIDTYIAAGASMGCATALHAAVLAPERITGLVLVIPPTAWESREGQADNYQLAAKVLETAGVEPFIAASAEIAPPDPFLEEPDYREMRASGIRSWDPNRLAAALRGATTADFPPREAVSQITCPTLILAWTGDAGHPVSTVEALQELLPQAKAHLASTAADMETWTGLVAGFVAQSKLRG